MEASLYETCLAGGSASNAPDTSASIPAALYAKAVDAYCTGEPFGAAAQRAGYARVLRMTRDEWRNYICCVLTVREGIKPRRAYPTGERREPQVF